MVFTPLVMVWAEPVTVFQMVTFSLTCSPSLARHDWQLPSEKPGAAVTIDGVIVWVDVDARGVPQDRVVLKG